jgi:hypothetical protein
MARRRADTTDSLEAGAKEVRSGSTQTVAGLGELE